MSQGFSTPPAPFLLPVPVSLGGTGLISAGAVNSVPLSDGVNYVSTPVQSLPINFGLSFIMARGIY